MEASPLTQQVRPETFQPKIVQLYDTFFKTTDYIEPTEGFWREFFLLPPDTHALNEKVQILSPDDVLTLHSQTQQLFARCIREVASEDAPNDVNALDTLTAFLASVLVKKYTNPSSDIITILSGLDEVDQVFTGFVSVLDRTIRNGRNFAVRLKAIRTVIALVGGAYKTGLVSYFTHRDLFPSLMKFINDSDDPIQILEPFILLGLLTNYNKFEFQNPYQQRLDDFVNETSIRKIVKGIGLSCAALRNGYVAVQDDVPEGWTLTSTLIFFGLRAFASRAKESPLTLEEAKEMFTALPAPEAAILLATYDFSNANKLFGFTLVAAQPEKHNEEAPISSFLSLTSYLLQHAYRSSRVTQYAELNLFILRILVEDPVLCKRLCSDESNQAVRLCRQRQPYLPLVAGERILATVVLDLMIDAISHNLRRRLDANLYCHTIAILLRLFTYLSSNKIRLAYHWSEIWRTLLSLMRFLTTYVSDLSSNPQISSLTGALVDLIAFAIASGDTFLPDPASYDDLFYKIVETGPIITRFRDAYKLSSTSKPKAKVTSSTLNTAPLSEKPSLDPGVTNTGPNAAHVPAIDTLISVSTHFYSLVFDPSDNKASKETAEEVNVNALSNAEEAAPVSPISPHRKKNLRPRDVHHIIKQGYNTLSIQAREGLNTWEKWREADWKVELKRSARCAVEDARRLVV